MRLEEDSVGVEEAAVGEETATSVMPSSVHKVWVRDVISWLVGKSDCDFNRENQKFFQKSFESRQYSSWTDGTDVVGIVK